MSQSTEGKSSKIRKKLANRKGISPGHLERRRDNVGVAQRQRIVSVTPLLLIVIGGVLLLFDWRVGLPLLTVGLGIWLWRAVQHYRSYRRVENASEALDRGLEELRHYYASPEGITELKSQGFSDIDIEAIQELDEEAIEKLLSKVEKGRFGVTDDSESVSSKE